ncbi:hypothetical protein BD769DRAFT_1383076 [Suillus cothurnatus]|nr:hypothetical protein BD769DRAFT_1383076 [Suillus cothurnatus]
MPRVSGTSPWHGFGLLMLTWGVQITHGMRNESLVKGLPGHACYSGRQSHMYSLLAQDAQAAFQELQNHMKHKFPPNNLSPGKCPDVQQTFVTPLLQYAAARNIISVVPTPVSHILQLFPMLTWNTVPDDVFSSHLCQFDDAAVPGHPSWIVSDYDTPWWIGHTTIPNEPWKWNQCGVEDDGLVLPEQVDHTCVSSLVGLRCIRERLVELNEEQNEGIHEKMAEVKMYTDMLERLKRGRGE